MADPKPLNRQQLSAFLKDPESIRGFERLFEKAGTETPSNVDDLSVDVGNAQSSVNNALELINKLAEYIDVNLNENNAIQALQEIETLKNILLPVLHESKKENELNVISADKKDYIDFPIAPYVETDRRLAWDNENLTLTMGLVNYQLKIGQNTIFCVKNVSGATINKGQSVMATGVLGASAKIEAGLAIADGSINAMMMLGVAAQDIANNAFGYVTQFGKVRGFNTTGAAYGETWADGDVLYFNPNVAGGLTKVAPTAPDLNLPIAYVLNASAGSGSIFVRMKQGEYLNELHDVAITSPATNQALIYDGTVWENTTLKTVNGNSLIGAGNISVGGGINSGTVVTLTTQTSVDVTGIPAGVKRITLIGSGISTNGTSNIMFQLGDSGGIESTGYLGAHGHFFNLNSSAPTVVRLTTGLGVASPAATSVIHFNALINNISGNNWVFNVTGGYSAASSIVLCGGYSKSLTDILTQIRLTTVNGTDLFDAGTINIFYE